MKKASKNPIIFLPGLMGSIGEEMIPGIGPWRFGPAKWVYDPFIEGLESIGYGRDQNLYICFYDWRKNIETIVEEYLLPIIQKVKKSHPQQQIDIIGHSMGGIVARKYIQGSFYDGNVENLIMLGSPNKGSVEAYYLWSTGTLMPAKKKAYQAILYRGYIWLLTKLIGLPMGIKELEKLHHYFPGLGDLIPANDYGEFLCIQGESGRWFKVPRKYMTYQNETLDSLNNEWYLLKERVKNIYCCLGTGFDTNHLLELDKEEYLYRRNEVILNVLTTYEGDGTVTVDSGMIEGLENIIIPSSHRGIVEDSLQLITPIYGGTDEEIIHIDKLEVRETVHIIVKGDVDLTLEVEEIKILSYEDRKIITSQEYLQEYFTEEVMWLVLKNYPNGHYTLKIKSNAKQIISVMVMSTDVELEYTNMVYTLGRQEIFNFTIRN